MKNEHAITETTEVSEAPSVIQTKNEGLAAVLSLLVPGLGQLYTGNYIWGAFWLLGNIFITPGLWLGSAGTLWWLYNLVVAIHAHRLAKQRNES